MGPWAGALLAFLAWVLVSPQTARAGCAHDGRFAASAGDHGTGLDLLLHAGALAEPSDAERPEHPRRPPPCSGAMCSGQPAPPSSPVVPDPLRVGSWAVLTVPVRVAAPEPSAPRRDESDARPLVSGRSVFRPPPGPSAPSSPIA